MSTSSIISVGTAILYEWASQRRQSYGCMYVYRGIVQQPYVSLNGKKKGRKNNERKKERKKERKRTVQNTTPTINYIKAVHQHPQAHIMRGYLSERGRTYKKEKNTSIRIASRTRLSIL